MVQSQPEQKFKRPYLQKQKRAGGGPEFKPQYCKRNKNKFLGSSGLVPFPQNSAGRLR
jgi:hypothetical protein